MKKKSIEGTSPPFRGTITLPGDKSISHRALMLAAISKGTSIIQNFSERDDVQATCSALKQLGITTESLEPGKIKVGSHLQGAPLKSFGDHRIATAFSIAALFAKGKITIDDTSCIGTSYPFFATELQALLSKASCQET